MSEEKPDLTEGGKKPWFRVERRSRVFVERLSIILVVGAFFGGYIVLLDIRATLTFFGQLVSIGKDGFAAEAKGMVLQSMLIGGLAAVIAYWLGTSKQGQEQAQTVSRMAESAAPSQAQAVAAARAPASDEPIVPEEEDAVTPAPKNPVTGNVPAAEVTPSKGPK